MGINFQSYTFFDPKDEEPLLLGEAAKELGVTYRALWDYAYEGCEGASGERVKLQVCRMPSGLGTTVESYKRFISRLSTREM